MKKLILPLILFFLFFSAPTLAADVTIDCPGLQSGECTLTGDTPLFSDSQIWSPGMLLSKTFTLTNSGPDIQSMGLFASRFGSPSILEDVLTLSITGPNFIWAGHLSKLYTDGEIILGNFAPGESRNYQFSVSFDQFSGNNYQNQKAIFDLTLGFIATDLPPILTEIYPNPSSGQEFVEIYNPNNHSMDLTGWKIKDIANNTININTNLNAYEYKVFYYSTKLNNDGDTVYLYDSQDNLIDSRSYSTSINGQSYSRQSGTLWCQTEPTPNTINNPCLSQSDGQVAGTSTSNPPANNQCTDTPPASAPILNSITAGLNSVTLSWTEGLGPISYYLIAYGDQSGLYQYGNPNIGGQGTISYTINDLFPNQIYYFVVRAGNGCAPGPFSNELSTATSGVPILPNTIPSGFQPNVLGESTEVDIITAANPSGSVAGISKCSGNWIPLLWLVALFLNLIYAFGQAPHRFFFFLLTSLSAFLVDRHFLSTNCCLISFYCQFFWLGNITAFIIPQIIKKIK